MILSVHLKQSKKESLRNVEPKANGSVVKVLASKSGDLSGPQDPRGVGRQVAPKVVLSSFHVSHPTHKVNKLNVTFVHLVLRQSLTVALLALNSH